MIVDDGSYNGQYEIKMHLSDMNVGYYYLAIKHMRTGTWVLTMTGTRAMIADAVRAWVMASE